MLKATKVRLYPTPEQELALAKSFGCARWYWNFALNACIQHYQETGKSLKLASYKGMLPQLKIDRFFPSSKTCSSCGYVVDELPLNIREWDCPNCHTHHDRDENASLNIRNEGIRILQGGGNPVSAEGVCVRPDNRKVKGHRAMKSEAHTKSGRIGLR